MRTLCIDIGGTGIKAIVLDAAGSPITERGRIETPKPATPEAVLGVIEELARGQGEFERVSVGFPGVVKDGVTKTAPNLDPSWANVHLADEVQKRLNGKPVRAANDAAIQGLGVIEGKGVEMVITLGTGMGSSLYVDGKMVPMELGHHPFRKGKTYEELLSDEALREDGKKRWRKRFFKAVAMMDQTFNYRKLYVGGGNARILKDEKLPEDVTLVDNVAGLLGGIRLWQ